MIRPHYNLCETPRCVNIVTSAKCKKPSTCWAFSHLDDKTEAVGENVGRWTERFKRRSLRWIKPIQPIPAEIIDGCKNRRFTRSIYTENDS